MHSVVGCSECGFASAVKDGVKRHLQRCKKGQGKEWNTTMVPKLVPRIVGDGRDDQDEEEGAQKDIPEPKDDMTVDQLNELGAVWVREFAEKTKSGVRIRHPTHAETQSIKKSQELA
jgi:hypothetical protein